MFPSNNSLTVCFSTCFAQEMGNLRMIIGSSQKSVGLQSLATSNVRGISAPAGTLEKCYMLNSGKNNYLQRLPNNRSCIVCFQPYISTYMMLQILSRTRRDTIQPIQ